MENVLDPPAANPADGPIWEILDWYGSNGCGPYLSKT
jgi:hypothetical protein